MGEKEHFHDAATRVPLIILIPTAVPMQPRTVCNDIVQMIDLLPTFLDVMAARRCHIFSTAVTAPYPVWRDRQAGPALCHM